MRHPIPIPAGMPVMMRLAFVLSMQNKYCMPPSITVGRINKTAENIDIQLITIPDNVSPKVIAVHLQQKIKQKPKICGARSLLELHIGLLPTSVSFSEKLL